MLNNSYNNNINSIHLELKIQIENSNKLGSIQFSKNKSPILEIDSVYIHSQMDPVKESIRHTNAFLETTEKKIILLIGAGLGYDVIHTLQNENNYVVWFEPFPEIIKHAFEYFDFSKYLKMNRLRIVLPPFSEDKILETIHGISGYTVVFHSHRGSLAWKKKEYSEIRFILEKIFKKKNANIATLTKFEKIWTKNFLLNLPYLVSMKPVSVLFSKAKDLDIMICGAGPSLLETLETLKINRNQFILLAVDTALKILTKNNIDPDLVFTVDPQFINSAYLEGYNGNTLFIFDPTCAYVNFRLNDSFADGFVTDTPFPMGGVLKSFFSENLGEIEFGGSVSTNAVSLAEKMEAKNILLIGQDLSFTYNLAHCRGAILEDRLKYKVNKYFSIEMHNQYQLTALPKRMVKGIGNENLVTNDKLLIFQKWFNEKIKISNWINLSSKGIGIENVPNISIKDYFLHNKTDLLKIEKFKKSLQDLKKHRNQFSNVKFKEEINTLIIRLEEFKSPLKEGVNLSNRIYHLVKENKTTKEIHKLLDRMNFIDETISQKKGLNQFLSSSIQRVILMVTEGYEVNLSIEEKQNEYLGNIKKSILLYEGLLESVMTSIKALKKIRLTSFK